MLHFTAPFGKQSYQKKKILVKTIKTNNTTRHSISARIKWMVSETGSYTLVSEFIGKINMSYAQSWAVFKYI